MSRILLLLTLLASGCKTAEFAVDHQLTGIHVAAKFEAKDVAADARPADASINSLASRDESFDQRRWNGGDSTDAFRR